jgi:hypothetical protein
MMDNSNDTDLNVIDDMQEIQDARVLIEHDRKPKTRMKTVAQSSGSSGPDIKWFSEADYDDAGKIATYLPSYTKYRRLEELREDVKEIERIVNDGIISGRALNDLRNKLAYKKQRLEKLGSKPRITGFLRDKLKNALDDLSGEINSALFSYDEARKVSVSAHENVRRMTTPCIPVRDSLAGSIAKECNIRVHHGKVTREEAIRIAKIMKYNLGESVAGSFQYRC